MTDAPPLPSRRLVAVVVTYNRLDKLRATLSRLLSAPEVDLAAVVVVDNASTDGTGSWLADQADPRLDIHCLDHNIGGAGGFARGMERAMTQHAPDWLVLMDDDARPAPGALTAFRALPGRQWDAVAAAVYFPDGRICEMNRPSRNPFWSGRVFLQTLHHGRAGFHIPDGAYDGAPRQIDVTSFVGLFIRADAVMRHGYPDAGLFLYGDDALYTLTLSAGGGRIGFEPSIRFEHDLSTFDGAQRRFHPLWKAYYYHRNLLLLYRRAAGWLFWPACLIVLPRWFWSSRRAGALQTQLLRRAVADGLRARTDLTHAQVLALAGEAAIDSGYPGDTAPEAQAPETAGRG